MNTMFNTKCHIIMDVSRRKLSELELEKVFMVEEGTTGLIVRRDRKAPDVLINRVTHSISFKFTYSTNLNMAVEDRQGNTLLIYSVKTDGDSQLYDISRLPLRANYTLRVFGASVRYEGVFNT